MIVFGLSMDYEVFLLSRIKEEYEVGAIIQVLFHSLVFLLSRIKEEYERIGDATNSVADGLAATARVTAAAAMVELLGARDWWLPHWLDRIIPNLEVDPRGEPAYPAGFHRYAGGCRLSDRIRPLTSHTVPCLGYSRGGAALLE